MTENEVFITAFLSTGLLAYVIILGLLVMGDRVPGSMAGYWKKDQGRGNYPLLVFSRRSTIKISW